MSEILRIFVQGRVQGVGFRQFTQETAHRLGVAGWVRNLPDGRVEALVRIPPENKTRFLAALRRGPSYSRVQQLSVEPAGADSSCPEKGFRILH
ncbi:MAG: acylphosphatase [Deltaproteobacteria bacterium]|nr:acylphosphatase [Deltaproteobacteria bacterium]